MAELQPSKLVMRVRSPSPALFQAMACGNTLMLSYWSQERQIAGHKLVMRPPARRFRGIGLLTSGNDSGNRTPPVRTACITIVDTLRSRRSQGGDRSNVQPLTRRVAEWRAGLHEALAQA